MIPPTVNRKPTQLFSSLFSHPLNPVSIVSHSMAAFADLEKKYILIAKRTAYTIPGIIIHFHNLCFRIKRWASM